MSSIGSISGTGVDVSQLIRRLASQADDENATGAKKSERPDRPQPEEFDSMFGQALKAAGVSDEEVSEIQDEIKSAIASASQNQDRSSSDGRDGIKTAIDNVLTEHGLDPDKVQEQFQSIAGPPPGGPPPGAGGPGGAGGSDSAAGTSSTTSETQATQSIEELIQQMLASGNLDSATAQLLQGLLPSLDATA